MHWLYSLQKVKIPPHTKKKKREEVSWEWHLTASGAEAPVMEILKVYSIPSLPLLPDPLTRGDSIC